MTLPRSLRAALVLLVVALAGLVAVPRGVAAWQQRQDRQHNALLAEQMAATARVLTQLAPPAGATGCGTPDGMRYSGDVCWVGPQTPGQAARALARQLRQLDARDVLVRCARGENGTTSCAVQAMVVDHLFSALVGQPFTSDPPGSHFRMGGSAITFLGTPGPGTPVPPEQA